MRETPGQVRIGHCWPKVCGRAKETQSNGTANHCELVKYNIMNF
jgi:hypothetical protein